MKILFYCHENPAKRKMAAQIANHFNHVKAEIFVSQCSFDASDHMVINALRERKVYFDESRIGQSVDTMKEKYDLIIVLCNNFKVDSVSYPGFPAVLYWPLESPVKKDLPPGRLLDNLRVTRDELIIRLKHLFMDGYLNAFHSLHGHISSLYDEHAQSVILFNRDEQITGINREASELLGYREEDVIGKPLYHIFPDDMVSRHALAITDEGEEERKSKLRVKLKNQDIKKVTATFSRYSSSKGQGGMLYLEDIESEAVLPIEPMDDAMGMERLSWDRVETALRQTGGNRSKASKLLGVGRATFYRFLVREKAKGRIPNMEFAK